MQLHVMPGTATTTCRGSAAHVLLLSPHVYMWISGSAQLCAGLTLQSDCHLRVGPSPVHTMQVSEALNHAGRMQVGVAC